MLVLAPEVRLTCGVELLRLVLELRVSEVRLTCGVAELLRLVLELRVSEVRLTCGVAELLRLVRVSEVRLTCGVAELLRLVLVLEERLTCGVAELLRLALELLELLERLTAGALVLSERETAADWLLLVVLPPCERPRPWAEASDAPMIRHPMSAKLIIKFLTEVFIIVMCYIVQQMI